MQDAIFINPVGIVRSDYKNTKTLPLSGQHQAQIEIFPQYAEALHRIEENSHLWVLSWFHLAPRHRLRNTLGKYNPTLPEYGVFGLRTPGRPNPLALTLVRLLSVKENILCVEGLDAVDQTPVIDIKPYKESDIIFSPITPFIYPLDKKHRVNKILKQALAHHQEECLALRLAVRMAAMAQEEFGHLNTPDLKVSVKGSACLADSLQGITRARLANPARFDFIASDTISQSTWQKGDRILVIEAHEPVDLASIMTLPDKEIFLINRYQTQGRSTY